MAIKSLVYEANWLRGGGGGILEEDIGYLFAQNKRSGWSVVLTSSQISSPIGCPNWVANVFRQPVCATVIEKMCA